MLIYARYAPSPQGQIHTERGGGVYVGDYYLYEEKLNKNI